MAGRRRIVKIGPPTRGLTDFPEHASPEHSTQALNVEYVNGGVSTRRGTQLIRADFYKQGGGWPSQRATIKLVRQFSLGPNSSEMTVVGFVPTSGGDSGQERILVDVQENLHATSAVLLPPGEHSMLTAADGWALKRSSSRWDACMFMDSLVVCTDHLSPFGAGDIPRVHYKTSGNIFGPLSGVFTGPVDRTRFPFHQGGDNRIYGSTGDAGKILSCCQKQIVLGELLG